MDEKIQTTTIKDLDATTIQEKLLVERRIRITIMSLLLGALLFTTIYGTLQDPFGGHAFSAGRSPIYAVYTGSAGTNMEINIGDAWKDVDKIEINIGDAWKDVTKIEINIGDAWKTVFG